MINITNNLNEMFEFANVDDNDLDGGEDLEDGEIFDDEAEAEDRSETEVQKTPKVDTQKKVSAAPTAARDASPVAKSVLKTDAHNVLEKKSEKLAGQQRWADERAKKEEKNSAHLEPEKRSKEKKLKRKKAKDEDSENDGPKFKEKKRKTSFERELEKLDDSDYLDEEDEQMLNIRGASPGKWMDIFTDDEDGGSFDGSDGGRDREMMRGGRGGAARRRGSGFRGGRIDRLGRRERVVMNSRGKRRGKGIGMRGGKRRGEDKDVCIYHMQGKCHRGNDCPFSHDVVPPRKMELCKFYLMDCCAKKDKCLYMHSEFPCKYFHTGLKCFAGKNCKFSHAKLTDELRAILNKHLETAPKDILGDFPRLREATRNLKKCKNIPSLFDLRISPPPRDMQSDSDGNHTPMPSPTHQPNNKDFFRESVEREHTPPQMHERRRGEHHHKSEHRSSKSGSLQQQSRRTDRFAESPAESSRGARRDERRESSRSAGRRSSREDSAGEHQHHPHHGHYHGHHHHHGHHYSENSSRAASAHGPNNSRRQQSFSPPTNHHHYDREWHHDQEQMEEEEREREREVPQHHPIDDERLKAPEPDQSSNDILSHLPKKQRELFLRIQQQQRQAENSQESNPEDEDQDNDYNKQEENWYSSDEESTPLTTILKNINIPKTPMTNSSLSPNQNQHQQRNQHHHDQQSHTQVSDDHQRSFASSSSSVPPQVAIPDIDFGDVSALLSKVKQHFQTTADRSKVRDPRLRADPEPSEMQHQHSTSSGDSSHTLSNASAHARTPLAPAQAPTQLSPSISAILNSATRAHHHPQPTSRSSPPPHHQQNVSPPSLPHSTPHSHTHHQNVSPSPTHSSSHSHHHQNVSPSHRHSLDSYSQFPSSHHHNRLSSYPPATPSLNDDADDDDDMVEDSLKLKGLPFKPVPMHTAATEIDASINSHPPIVYRLVPIAVSKPDYSSLQIMPKGGALDPRWRKAVRFSEELGAGAGGNRRDPRHRLVADDPPRPSHPPLSVPTSDPRQRVSAASMLAPPTPRYDDDYMSSRAAATPQMDATYCPPTPRLDDEPPQPSPIVAPKLRLNDPRQRQHMMNQSLYDQIRQQQQMQFVPNQQQMMFDPSRPMYANDMSANISSRQPQYNNYK